MANKEFIYKHVIVPLTRTSSNSTPSLENQKIDVNIPLESPLLDNTTNYECAIAYMSLPLADIPIFYCDDGVCSFQVGLYYNNTTLYEKAVLFTGENSITSPFTKTGYVYSREQICNAINNSFLLAGIDLNTAHPGSIPLVGGVPNTPKLFWDADSGKFKLMALSAVFGAGVATPIEYCVDYQLFNKIFNSFAYSVADAPLFSVLYSSYAYKIKIQQAYGNSATAYDDLTPGGTYYVMSSEYINESQLAEIQGIRMKYTGQGIKPEIALANNLWLDTSGTAQQLKQPIMQDLILSNDVPDASRGKAVYIPINYNWHDIYSGSTPNSIKFQLKWLTGLYQEVDFSIPVGKSIIVKLLYRKKLPQNVVAYRA